MDNHEVISAFLDNEPFDPARLANAIMDPDGRQMLVDLVALRALLHDQPIAAPLATARMIASRSKWIAVGFLAASVLFGAGAAWMVPRLPRAGGDAPPRPDHVVTFETDAANQ